MNGLSPRDVLKNREALELGASVTEEPVTKEIGLSAGGSLAFRVDMKVSSVTSSTGITAKLQHKLTDTWTDLSGANASVSITGNGVFSLSQLYTRSADEDNMPVSKQVRVVVSTGAGDAVTFDEIEAQYEL